VTNTLLLIAEAILYFSLMVMLFRLRGRIGIGVFMCALGVMHFLETYLASVFYIALPFGMLSPGSTVMFSGKLAMLLLLYIKEDATTVRQPIYGLLLGNALMIGLVLLLRLHEMAPLADGRLADIGFIDQMGWLMVWGTALLYVDAILIILLFERLGRPLRNSPFLRISAALCCVLTFDQIGFFTALHFVTDAPLQVLIGGWVAKMGASLIFSVMLVVYLSGFETQEGSAPRGLADIFQTLTYRERYEALVEHVGRDGLTGLLHRGRFESDGEQAVAASLRTGKPQSLVLIDVDYFKSINDRFGHAEGDRVLKAIATLLKRLADADDRVFRIGGEEFAILSPRPHSLARLLGENIRQAIKDIPAAEGAGISVSGGIASVTGTTRSLADLFDLADRRLYAAKSGGRDRMVGDGPLPVAERTGPRSAATGG
jgi:diguanylate cyclase (GGDEF)-like protein